MTSARRESNPVSSGMALTRPEAARHPSDETDRAPDNDIGNDISTWYTAPSSHNKLTLPRTPLVGRDRDLDTIQHLLLQEHVGLLTLTGPGGIGKTRLALQVAANLLDHFVDGLYFVSLAPILDSDLVNAAIAQTLGLRELPARPLQESLQAYLRYKQLLLVLDNFEQILAAAPLVGTLLTECRRLKVLVTSRAPLHLYGEQEFPVPPLALPILDVREPQSNDFGFGILPGQALDSHAVVDDHQPKIQNLKSQIDTASLTEYAAIDLFCQRAKAIKPDFVLTPANAADIAKICIGLDGLPLAIELAAARIKMFSPSALLARLQDKLTLLTGGSHDLPARQRTLRAEIAWSYDLLAPQEQVLFRRLAVFVGGFTIEAAKAIADFGFGILDVRAPRAPAQSNDCESDTAVGKIPNPKSKIPNILEGVTTLVDQNLLKQIVQTGGEARFAMLETMRDYGLDRLATSDEVEMVRCHHADFFLKLAEATEPVLLGPRRPQGLAHLEAELDNLRAALAWSAADQHRAEVGLRLAGALIWFAHFTNRFSEGRGWLVAALQRAPEPTAARAKALWGAGLMALNQGDYPIARVELEASEAIWRNIGNALGLAITLRDLCVVAHLQGRATAEQRYAEESVALCRTAGSQWDLALALDNLAYVVAEQQGDQTTARVLFQEERALFQAIGDSWGLANALVGLGCMAHEQGDYAAACAHFEQALTIRRTQTDNLSVAATLSALGQVRQCQGELAEAGNLYHESLHLTHEVGDKAGMALVFYLLGVHAYAQNQLERAACLFAVAATLRDLTGGAAYHTLDNRDTPETRIKAVRTSLGEESFAVHWAAGQALTVEQAIAYALAAPNAPEDLSPPQEIIASVPSPSPQPAGLTKRETEVLRLLVQGLTYTQIADQLVMSRRTVNVHATTIYSKLGVTSRAMATRVALEQQLL